jgi:hypothetical protein
MLQGNPLLSARQIKAILRASASPDVLTGSVPNVNWGYGRLDMLSAMDLVALTATRDTSLSLTANPPRVSAGETMRLDLGGQNPGPARIVDVHVGALLPASAGVAFGCAAGDAIALVSAEGVSIDCLSRLMPPHMPFAASIGLPAGAPPGLTRNFFSFVWPPSAPAGDYICFVAYTRPGTLDVVAVAFASVSFSP